MKGYRTYAGLAIALLGVLANVGVIPTLPEEQVAQVVDSAFSFLGLAIAAYGRYNVDKK